MNQEFLAIVPDHITLAFCPLLPFALTIHLRLVTFIFTLLITLSIINQFTDIQVEIVTSLSSQSNFLGGLRKSFPTGNAVLARLTTLRGAGS